MFAPAIRAAELDVRPPERVRRFVDEVLGAAAPTWKASIHVPAQSPWSRRTIASSDRPSATCNTSSATEDRLSRAPDGRVVVKLGRPWLTTGETEVVFESTEFLRKLAPQAS